MKNMKLPNNDEWKKIVDDAFSSEEFHVFSENYNMKKHSMQSMRKGITMKKNNLIMNLTVAAAALTVVAVPTGIYLTTRTAETEPATEISSEENSEMSAETLNNETFYALEMGWLPEGLEYQSESEAGYCYGHIGDEVKVLAQFKKNAGGVPINNIIYKENVVMTDESESEDRYTVINYYASYNEEEANPQNVGREVFVSFKGTDYFANIIVNDDISKDDLNKIIDEMKLIPSDKETAQDYYPEDMTEVEVNDGNDDGEVNEGVHQFTEDNTDYDTIYNVEYGWLPEGLEFQEQDSPYGGKFHDWNTDNGMTPMFMKIPKGMTYTENINFVTLKDTWLLDGKTVSMNYRDNYNPDNTEYNFGRIAVIYFDNTPYVLKLYITDGISKEDFRKIIDNVKLVPSEEETAGIYTPPKNEQENTEFTVGSYDRLGVKTEDSVTAQIGEEIYEKNPDIWGDVSAKINDVHFTDNFDGIKTDGIGREDDYSEYLNENGSLIENTRKWIKYYNDENGSIQREEIGTETVPVSVMTVNITYTNNGTTPVDDYCICPTLQTMYDGYFFMPHIYNTIQMSMREAMNNIDYNDTFHFLESDAIHFSFSCSNQSDKNNINIAPGESVEVTLAFIVEDGLRDNIYLSMNDNGFVDLSNIE